MTTAKLYTVQKYKLSYVKETTHTDLSERQITNRHDVTTLVKQYLQAPYEQIIVIALDNANRVTGMTVSTGTANQCVVYPSEVFRFLLSTAAVSFILAHNHPGGSMKPSEPDWHLTDNLHKIATGLGIPMLDHVIVCEDNVVSMREMTRWPA